MQVRLEGCVLLGNVITTTITSIGVVLTIITGCFPTELKHELYSFWFGAEGLITLEATKKPILSHKKYVRV